MTSDSDSGRAADPTRQYLRPRWRRPFVVLGFAASLSMAVASCASAAEVEGTWEGQILDDAGEAIDLRLELEADGSEITGDGVADGGLPLEVTGGEVEGADVTIEFQDGFGGERVQGELEGEMNGDTISGEGPVYSDNSSGEPQPFELQRTDG